MDVIVTNSNPASPYTLGVEPDPAIAAAHEIVSDIYATLDLDVPGYTVNVYPQYDLQLKQQCYILRFTFDGFDVPEPLVIAAVKRWLASQTIIERDGDVW